MIKKIFSCLIFSLATSCGTSPAPSNKPVVLVSIAPYQLLVEKIGKDRLEVHSVVPQAANPHSFEPTARQVVDLAKGAVWFRIGEAFEDKIIPILQERNEDLWIQDLRDGIDLISESSSLACHHCAMEHLDRHIWMSPQRAKVQAEAISETLQERFPEYAEEFKKNGLSLIQELVALDREIQEILKLVEKRQILVSHPAFGYFCSDYQIEQISIEYEGKDPRPRHLEEILQKAVKNSFDFAVALPQYNNKGAQIIAEKLHVPMKWIDPYSHDYFEMMRQLAKMIAETDG